MEWLIAVLLGGAFTMLASVVAGACTLLGVVIGAALGFGLTELRSSWERGRRRGQVAKLVKAEVVVNQEKLEETLNDHKQATDAEGWVFTSPFGYEAYKSCMADLALLGDDAMMAVVDFYARLAHVERVPRDALSALTQLYAVFRAGTEDEGNAARQEKHIKQTMRRWVLEREEGALKAADNAKNGLDKVIAQRRW